MAGTTAQTTRLVRFVASDDGQTYYGYANESLDHAEVIEREEIFSGPSKSSRVQKHIAKFLCPLAAADVSAIYCVGLNYKTHAEEAKMPIPQVPVIFQKPPTALAGPYDALQIPEMSWTKETLDFEAELVIVVGKTARRVKRSDALNHVLGYTVGNDVSSRFWQLDPKMSGGQWCLSKSFDDSAPIGPAIVKDVRFADANGLNIKGYLNDKLVQDSNTNDLIFPVAEIIEFLSAGMTLLPGTIVFTGTPAGVGFGRSPQIFLQENDIFTTEIEGIGRIKNKIIFERNGVAV